MRNILFAATIAALSTGCGNSEEIWAFFVDAPTDPEDTMTVTHNFNGAIPIDNGTTTTGDWTDTYTEESDPTLMFGQIVRTSGEDDAFLIMGGMAIPGIRSGGAWIFEWNDFEQSTDREQHVAGYYTQTVRDDSTTTTLTMNTSGGTAVGTIETVGTGSVTYTESDTWDANTVGRFSSDIPAGTYLEMSSDGSYVDNDYTLTDCTGGECMLQVTSVTDTSSNFRAERTKFSDEDVMNTVGSATTPN